MSTHVNFVAFKKSPITDKFEVFIVRGVAGSGNPLAQHWELVCDTAEPSELVAFDTVLPKLQDFYKYVDENGRLDTR